MSRKKSEKNAPRELLGRVKLTSGTLVVLDMGLMHFWCHDREPMVPPGVLDAELERNANAATDYLIEGKEAGKAGRAFDRPNDPLHVYDVAAHLTGNIEASFQKLIRKKRLDAKLTPLPARVTHRERVEHALKEGTGAFIFNGIMASAVGDVPVGEELPVYGERLGGKHYPDHWHNVHVECQPEVPVARSVEVGSIGVDEARLMFSDVEALGDWQHYESLDGLADLVFWGRDGKQLAEASGANELGEDQWGWEDIAIQEAILRGEELERLRDDNGWKLAIDFRPHSHHYQVMGQVRESETGSGTVELGEAIICGLSTSWGDGIFPVFRDLDEEGNLVRVRVELGCEAIVERQRKLDDWWHGFFAQLAMVSKRVSHEGKPVGYLTRDEPAREKDSGWIVYAGDEPDAFVDNAENWEYVVLREIVEKEPALEKILRAPPGSAYHRKNPKARFRKVPASDD